MFISGTAALPAPQLPTTGPTRYAGAVPSRPSILPWHAIQHPPASIAGHNKGTHTQRNLSSTGQRLRAKSPAPPAPADDFFHRSSPQVAAATTRSRLPPSMLTMISCHHTTIAPDDPLHSSKHTSYSNIKPPPALRQLLS